MTKLEKFYNSIENLKELKLHLNDETLDAVEKLEEELIQNELIPLLAESIEPIISKIQRPIELNIDYKPGENTSIQFTRKEIRTEDIAHVPKNVKSVNPPPNTSIGKKETSKKKGKKKKLRVKFPDGTVINETHSSTTLIETIEKIGPGRVSELNLLLYGDLVVSKEKNYDYKQHESIDGYLIKTHSDTSAKKDLIEEISESLNLDLKVDTV